MQTNFLMFNSCPLCIAKYKLFHSLFNILIKLGVPAIDLLLDRYKISSLGLSGWRERQPTILITHLKKEKSAVSNRA